MKQFRVLLLVLIFASLVVFGTLALAQQKFSFSIATGGTGGVWYPLGGAIGGIIGKKVPNTDATSEATTAAIDNLKLLAAGRVGLAFAYDYHVVWANEGKLEALGKKQPMRVVIGFYEQPLHIVTTDKTNIKSIMDLKGKRVCTGAPNSGTEEQADYVLKALGINWDKDMTREKLSATESVAAMKDGKIDAFFWSGAVPTSSIIDLSNTPGLKMVLVPVSAKDAAMIMKANPGVFHKTKFTKAGYNTLDKDVDAVAITAVLVSMNNFPADKMYLIVKEIFDNSADIIPVWKGAKNLTPKTAVSQLTPPAVKYIHAGAAKYYKEKGAMK